MSTVTEVVSLPPPTGTAPPNPLAMLQSLIERGADPERLEKMIALVERWEMNRAREAFGNALTGFQSDCPAILKDRTATVRGQGGEWQYRYESYDDLMAVVQPLLSRHRLAVDFSGVDAEGPGETGLIRLVVRLRVGMYYEDKHYQFPVPKGLRVNDSQAYGQALSYAKRYALRAALNIVVTDKAGDNDAATLYETVTGEQAKYLDGLIASIAGFDHDRFRGWLLEATGYGEIATVPSAHFGKVRTILLQKQKKAASAKAAKPAREPGQEG